MEPAPGVVGWVWARQSVWSQTANRLKAELVRARVAALGLTVVGAVAALAGAQLQEVNRPLGQGLGFAAALAVALVPIVRRAVSPQRVGEWLQARSLLFTLEPAARL